MLRGKASRCSVLHLSMREGHPLLPDGEKVPEGRMRGHFSICVTTPSSPHCVRHFSPRGEEGVCGNGMPEKPRTITPSTEPPVPLISIGKNQ
jgi:hypothetical protein